MDDRDKLRALLPFTAGGAELLLVPDQIGVHEPTVLPLARHRDSMFSEQLTLAEARRLAAYLNVVADKAEALAGSASAVHRVAI